MKRILFILLLSILFVVFLINLHIYIRSEYVVGKKQDSQIVESETDPGEGWVGGRGKKVNGKKEGLWKFITYPNKKGEIVGVFVEGNYVNNLKEGEWVKYFSNGKVMERITFVKGLRSNPKSLNRMMWEGNYKDGKKEGVWYFYSFLSMKVKETKVYENGIMVKRKCLDENGKEINCPEWNTY